MEIGSNRLVATAPPDHTIRSMALMLGDLPPGDVPGAWWSSTFTEVVTGYDAYKADKQAWNDQYAQLLKQAGLPAATSFVLHAGERLAGLVPPKGFAEGSQRWLRFTKNRDLLVPRKRTVAEKDSAVSVLWEQLEFVPQPVTYVPGMPAVMVLGDRLQPVHLRKPAQAVLAFTATAPEHATEPFEVGEQWSRMKLSTFHMLRERQEASKATGP